MYLEKILELPHVLKKGNDLYFPEFKIKPPLMEGSENILWFSYKGEINREEIFSTMIFTDSDLYVNVGLILDAIKHKHPDEWPERLTDLY